MENDEYFGHDCVLRTCLKLKVSPPCLCVHVDALVVYFSFNNLHVQHDFVFLQIETCEGVSHYTRVKARVKM